MVGVGGRRVLDVLRLATIPPRGYHDPPCGARCQVGACVLADQVQTQVQARCHSCRGQNGALVNEQDCGVDVDVGIPPRQLGGELPMGGSTPAVEQTGSSQREGPDAHRRDPGTVVRGSSQCRNYLRVRLFQESVGSRHHHEVRFREGIHPV